VKPLLTPRAGIARSQRNDFDRVFRQSLEPIGAIERRSFDGADLRVANPREKDR
jgi:hypothetical protein